MTDSVFLVADGTEIRATVEQGSVAADGTSLPVDFDRDRIWLFDDTGERVV